MTSTFRLFDSATRRQFLAASAAATAGTGFFLSHKARGGEWKDPYAGLPMGIQSFSLRKFDLFQALRYI